MNAVHEMSHAYDFYMGKISSTEEWLNLSQWSADGKGISTNFFEDYSKSSPAEDFADSIAAFVTNPDLLLERAPNKYEFISKRFFDGNRYDSKSLAEKYDLILKNLSTSEKNSKILELRLNDYFACKLL